MSYQPSNMRFWSIEIAVSPVATCSSSSPPWFQLYVLRIQKSLQPYSDINAVSVPSAEELVLCSQLHVGHIIPNAGSGLASKSRIGSLITLSRKVHCQKLPWIWLAESRRLTGLCLMQNGASHSINKIWAAFITNLHCLTPYKVQ